MLYQRRSFSVSSVSSKQNGKPGAMCAEKGHSGRDSRGRCYSCGERIPEIPLVGNEIGVIIFDDIPDAPAAAPEQLAGITHEPLDEPAPRTDLELVKLEGGPAGDLLAPISSLRRVAHTTIYTLEFGTQVLWYRSIGLETDSPRVFAFDGFSRGP